MHPAEAWDWSALRLRCLREARRIARDREEAEDIVQEALTRAWRNRLRCQTPADPIAWMLTITRNEAVRRACKTREAPMDSVPELADPAGAEQVERVHARVAVAAALRDVSPEDRRLLALRYVADMTQPAMAQRLGMPEGTTKVRLHRLRKRLKERLEQP